MAPRSIRTPGYLIVRANNVIGVNRVGKNDGSNPLVGVDYSNVFAGGGESATLPGGLPLISPPYAILAAIDLNRGEIAWKVPLGEGSAAIRNHPLLKGVALPERLGSTASMGGAMVTKSGLIFVGGGDGYVYAFETKTGKEVWREKMPVQRVGQSDDVSNRLGQTVRCHGDRDRRRQRARRVSRVETSQMKNARTVSS